MNSHKDCEIRFVLFGPLWASGRVEPYTIDANPGLGETARFSATNFEHVVLQVNGKAVEHQLGAKLV
jgi:hypothetical protein